MKIESSNNNMPIETAEPLTTVLDEGEFLRIHIKMPDITEEKIKIDLENQSASITIFASDKEIQYKKVIPIPCNVRFSKKRFSDGTLELILEKINSDNL